MARIKLDLDATDNLDFDRTIQIPDPKGAKPIFVTFKCKYRDRVEMAALFDGYRRDDDAPAPKLGESLVDITRANIKSDVEMLLDMVTGWDIDGYEFDAENLAKLLTKYPGAAKAIAADYRVSLTEGRLGNSAR